MPLSWKAWRPSVNAVTGRLLEMIPMLQSVERESGVRVRVALEPEPLCTLETAAETVAYWKDHLMPACRAKFGRGAEDLAHAYLGGCLDTCHHAVRWEGSARAIDLYREAGIPIGKIQLSSALEAASAKELKPFAEPRYLHQVVSKSGEARTDLGADPPPGPLRCHFHVPVHKEEVAGVRTTRDNMAAIASTTAPFCRSCDLSRITADGTWYLCLYADRGLDLRGPLREGATDAELADLVRRTWQERQDRGAERRLEAAARGVLYPIESLRADPRREMHTRGG